MCALILDGPSRGDVRHSDGHNRLIFIGIMTVLMAASLTLSGCVGLTKADAVSSTRMAQAPSITMQPAGETVTIGQAASFFVTASGSGPLSFQWRKNGAAISGATSAGFAIPATAMSDNGVQFSVVVTNSAGIVTSNAATLTVNAAVAGRLATSASTLNFNDVNIGSSSTLGATFTNTGSATITVTNVSISGAGFTPSGISTGLILTPGQNVILSTTFAPAATGNLTGAITVTSSASNPTASIALVGTGVQPAAHAATVTWTPSTSSTVTGYLLYRATASGGYTTPLTTTISAATTQFVDSTVQAGQTYYYVLTAVDPGNVQSKYSNEVSGTVPAP